MFEASDIDGCSEAKQIRYIVLPLLKPYFAVTIVLRFIYAFTTFDIIAGMTRGGPGHASMTLYYYTYLKSFEFLRLGEGAALSFIIFLIALGIGMWLVNRVFRGRIVA